MGESVDTGDLKSPDVSRAGSSPALATTGWDKFTEVSVNYVRWLLTLYIAW